ncbi:MAG TPA: gluconate 2-dehydrogenase subunit 3 family protein [Candidatus Dormibacteraeota bacterium]|nr:gluconate 2-dehydrogenase subunit 3 family protein [Candidatus Dormibacteraeota bacterium]
MIGRYPDQDVMADAANWDEPTRRVVQARLDLPKTLRFFTKEEEPTLRAFCDVVVFQDAEPRVPVVAMVDQKLHESRLDGFQYADMPDDRDTWRLVLRGCDEVAQSQYGISDFAAGSWDTQEALVGQLAQGLLGGGVWERVNVKRAWAVCARMILAAFYSHPWAWNEIGFGGPAYPRGYMRLGPLGVREPHETAAATAPDPVHDPRSGA